MQHNVSGSLVANTVSPNALYYPQHVSPGTVNADTPEDPHQQHSHHQQQQQHHHHHHQQQQQQQQHHLHHHQQHQQIPQHHQSQQLHLHHSQTAVSVAATPKYATDVIVNHGHGGHASDMSEFVAYVCQDTGVAAPATPSDELAHGHHLHHVHHPHHHHHLYTGVATSSSSSSSSSSSTSSHFQLQQAAAVAATSGRNSKLNAVSAAAAVAHYQQYSSMLPPPPLPPMARPVAIIRSTSDLSMVVGGSPPATSATTVISATSSPPPQPMTTSLPPSSNALSSAVVVSAHHSLHHHQHHSHHQHQQQQQHHTTIDHSVNVANTDQQMSSKMDSNGTGNATDSCNVEKMVVVAVSSATGATATTPSSPSAAGSTINPENVGIPPTDSPQSSAHIIDVTRCKTSPTGQTSSNLVTDGPSNSPTALTRISPAQTYVNTNGRDAYFNHFHTQTAPVSQAKRKRSLPLSFNCAIFEIVVAVVGLYQFYTGNVWRSYKSYELKSLFDGCQWRCVTGDWSSRSASRQRHAFTLESIISLHGGRF